MLARACRSATSAARRVAPGARAMSAAAGDYDLVVVGGGPGGYVAAIKAAQIGLKTACVESRGSLGGTCLNVGCIPSKALLHSSHMFHSAKHDFKKHGIIANDVSIDLDAMMGNKGKIVKGLTGGIEYLFKKNKVDYFKGHGKVASGSSVEVALNDGGSETISAKNVLIATGSEPSTLPPVPVDNEKQRIVDSTGALSLPTVPKKMVVIGAGVIGLEMGSVWSRLGSEVEVVEFLDRAVPSLDQELSKQFKKVLEKQGIKFRMATKVVASEVTDSGVVLTTEPAAGGEQSTIECDVCLVATGRRPFTGGLGLEELGIETDRLGRIPVDHEFRTSVPGVWAIGDVIDGPMLAHKAEEEGIAAVENIAGLAGHVNYDAIPGVIYTYPEVASVGKTEEQLKEEGVEYNTGVFPFSANSRAGAMMEKDGMVKMLADKTTDRILGVHIMGPNAGEMIAEGVIGMEYGASAEDIARTCHAHPTLSEAFKEAAMATYSKPIHF